MANPALPLTVNPARVEPQNYRRELSSSRAEGMVQTRASSQTVSVTTSKREVRRWAVGWDLLTTAEHAALLNTWESSLGGAQPVLWAPPGESPLLVHFLEFRSGAPAGPRWQAVAVLEEAL